MVSWLAFYWRIGCSFVVGVRIESGNYRGVEVTMVGK